MRILKKLYDPKKPDKLIRGEELSRAGFEFGFHTHVAMGTLNSKNEFIFCYNFGYREVYKNSYQLYTLNTRVKVKGGQVFNSR
jgi:hypothetical protein